MRRLFSLLATLATALLAASCANPQATMQSVMYGDPAAPYIGKSKSEIIACAGAPHANYASGATETLVYRYSGPGPRPGAVKEDDKDKKKGGFFGGDKKSKSDWDCTASLVFENGRLIRINFAHKDVDSPYAHQGLSAKDRAKLEEKLAKEGPQPPKVCSFVLPPPCGGGA